MSGEVPDKFSRELTIFPGHGSMGLSVDTVPGVDIGT